MAIEKRSFWEKILKPLSKKTEKSWYDAPLATSMGSDYYLTEQTIMKIPEFMSAMEMIANDFAKARFHYSEVNYNGTLNIKSNKIMHKSAWENILNNKPNDFMTAFELKKYMIWNYFLRTGAYLFVVKKSNKIQELIPIDPDLIEKVQDKDGNRGWELTLFEGTNKSKQTIPYDQVIAMEYSQFERVSDKSFSRIYSSLLEQLGMANQYDITQLNAAPRMLMHVKVPTKITEDEQKKIKDSFSTFFKNSKNPNSSAILVTDPKLEVVPLGGDKTTIKSPVDKEFTNKIMIKLSNALHIPAPKLNLISDDKTYKSREQVNIDYLEDAIQPLLELFTSQFNSIFVKNISKNEFIYDTEKLMVFDIDTKGKYTHSLSQNGVWMISEARKFNGLPYVDGTDIFLANGTMTDPLAQPVEEANQEENTLEEGGKDE